MKSSTNHNEESTSDKSINTAALLSTSSSSSTTTSTTTKNDSSSSYNLEKKVLQTAEKSHAEHDIQLRSLENGPYLLGHYLIYILMLAYYALFLVIGFIAC